VLTQRVLRHAAIAAIATAVACGGSSRRTPESRDGAGGSGGASGGRDNQETGGSISGARGGGAGAGGSGAGAAPGNGGSDLVGGQGAAAGTAAGAPPAQGGAAGAPPAQGGAAGAAAGQAGAGGMASAAFVPPWLPTGAFGDAAQHLVDAATEYVFWLCATNGLPIAECTRTELHRFAPSLEWLACTSRAPGGDEVFEQLASRYVACTTELRECGCLQICGITIPLVDGCSTYQSHACPDGGQFVYRCDESDANDCNDGYARRNCDPSADRYDCGDGGFVAWTDVCDGSPDCANAVDEFRCGPTGGVGGAAGNAPD
jgi:hypothetical protein